MAVLSTGLHTAEGYLFSSMKLGILYTGLNEKDNSQSGLLRTCLDSSIKQENEWQCFKFLKSSFICNNLAKNYLLVGISQHLGLSQVLLLAGHTVEVALKWKSELDLHIIEHTVSELVEISHSLACFILNWKFKLPIWYYPLIFTLKTRCKHNTNNWILFHSLVITHI